LSIVVSSTVETLRTNPFDFLLPPGGVRLPLRYPESVESGLTSYLRKQEVASEVREAAETVMRRVDGRTVPFLAELTRWIHASFEKVVRLEGAPVPAAETLAIGSGSCRDLAVLFNEICRAVGLASRFVSGYHERESPDGRRYLHAWSEVYLPGAGWRGFDPTEGLAVADRHVALASGLQPVSAAPTDGTFRGNGASSTLDSQIVLRTGTRHPANNPTPVERAPDISLPIDAVA
jgi:transglutaminase-like putative cysteine protease